MHNYMVISLNLELPHAARCTNSTVSISKKNLQYIVLYIFLHKLCNFIPYTINKSHTSYAACANASPYIYVLLAQKYQLCRRDIY